MSTFLQATTDGLGVAPVYILAAASFVLVYRATGVFNFAQGSLMMLGAYAIYELYTRHALAAPAAAVVAAALLAMVGGGVYVLLLKPLTGQPTFALIIVTMALAIIATGPVGIIWGFTTQPVSLSETGMPLQFGTVRMSVFDVWSIVITLVAMAALALFFRYTRVGLRMRATSENQTLAGRRGINVQRIYTLAWVLAGATAGLAGTLVAFRSGASPQVADVGLVAFPAALVGGFDSLGGALLGGVVIALTSSYAATVWGAPVENMVVFSLMLAIMLVRPYGLFGTPEIQRV